jgi:predicted dehydrogenase
MIKVGIIGCGNIADFHAEQIKRIPGCEIVGVCDREELMAKQLYERFPVRSYFHEVDALLEQARPDVVHITTPPQSHYELGKRCLEAGCHVYLEKPFALNAAECERLIELANQRKLKVTVGHDDQFTHSARRMRELARSGYLGGQPWHMESYYCYDLGDERYAKALLGDRGHWVRSLPGKLLHNNISHGISRIAEFLVSDRPAVTARGFTSPFLKRLKEEEIIDELRVIIDDGNGVTAYFTFSSQMRPILHQFRIYGPRNALIVDHDHQTAIRVRGSKFKSHLDRFLPPVIYAKEYLANALGNLGHFIGNEFHMKSGMRFLIEAFYRSVREDAPLPIPYREILLTARIMDDIFQQIYRDGGDTGKDPMTNDSGRRPSGWKE